MISTAAVARSTISDAPVTGRVGAGGDSTGVVAVVGGGVVGGGVVGGGVVGGGVVGGGVVLGGFVGGGVVGGLV